MLRYLLLFLLIAAAACGLDIIGRAASDAPSPINGDGSSSSDAASVERSDAGGDETTASSDADANAQAPCPVEMVFVDAGADADAAASSYCIDALEVTELQYGQLTAADASVTMPPICDFKMGSFRVGTARGAQRPVAEIDWCDALRYCAWKGKRLCTPDEWLRGCNGGTGTAYPYGEAHDASTCFGAAGVPEPVNVGSLPGCRGLLPIFDMSGNIDEWITCEGSLGAADICITRGGDYGDVPTSMRCDSAGVRTRGAISAVIGMRCCK